MEPTPNQEFHISDLLACVNREVAMRKSCYPKWDKVDSLDKLTPGRKRELAMMSAVSFTLTAQSELIGRLTTAPLADAALAEHLAFVKKGLAEIRGEDDNASISLASRCDDADEFISGLLARLRAAEATKWIAVSDQLPAPKQNVLAVLTTGSQVTATYKGGVWRTGLGTNYTTEYVTHWQPELAGPETVKGGQPNA